MMPKYEEAIELEWDTKPPDRPKIVCLCGSVRFKAQFEEVYKRETEAGHIVLAPGSYDKATISTELKIRLDLLHMRKIDLCDEVIVINVNGYVGESTTREIDYAQRTWKEVKFLYQPPFEAQK